MFSGYLQVDEANDVNYFYWFAECDGCDPATAPLALWTNGGPGCSGLLGFMTEQGPLRAQADGTLAKNPYAWNRVANYLFIEQPVGVGFSYSTSPAAYLGVGDPQAARLNRQLLLKFLARFPQYAAHDLFITSESYGGHYMPTLAREILEHNAHAAQGGGDSNGTAALNLKGLAVGNPYTDPVENAIGAIDTLYGRAMVPYPPYAAWSAGCRGKRVGDAAAPAVCVALQELLTVAAPGGDVNPYALDWPTCLDAATGRARLSARQARTAAALGRAPRRPDEGLARGQEAAEAAAAAEAAEAAHLAEGSGHGEAAGAAAAAATAAAAAVVALPGDPEGYDPCMDAHTATYLNRADVKAALHAHPNITWAECSAATVYGTLVYDPLWLEEGMEGHWEYLLGSGADLRMLVYSGDDDSVCGAPGTMSWLYNLEGATASGAWHTWKYNSQVAGYVQKFANTNSFAAAAPGAAAEAATAAAAASRPKGGLRAPLPPPLSSPSAFWGASTPAAALPRLAFATVHGAGHEVPTYKPAQALELITAFFQDSTRLF